MVWLWKQGCSCQDARKCFMGIRERDVIMVFGAIKSGYEVEQEVCSLQGRYTLTVCCTLK